jgi:hypothetical protein
MYRNTAGRRLRSLAILLFGSLVISTLFIGTQSEGAEFTFKPSIILREEYDDNIFLTRDNTEGDYITRALPSVSMNYKGSLWDWTLNYTLHWWYYAKLREGNTSHDATIVSKTKLIQNFLYLDVYDTYSSVVLNPRLASTETNLQQNRSDTNVLSVSPYVKYEIDPAMALSGGYRYTNIWYRQESGINRQMHTGFVAGEFLISPVVTLKVNADFTADRPEKTFPDNNQVSLFAGVVYKISPKMNFDATLGWRWIDFEVRDDAKRPVYNMGLIYRLSEKGQIELRAAAVVLQSPEEGIYDSRTEQITVRYGETISISGSIFHRYDKYLERDRKDDVYGVTTSLEYRPDQRLTFGINGGYEKDKYLPQNEKRDIYTGALIIDYKLTAKATLGATYNFNKSTGDIHFDNYTDNVIGLQLKVEI